tara:strand:- start:1 stop:489 length:489 start_codon:yes stop_codon:yes gene_type:complete
MQKIKQIAVDNLPITGLVIFFSAIGLFHWVNNHAVYRVDLPVRFEDEFTPEEQAKIRESLRWQMVTWQSDFDTNSRAANVIVRRECFKDDDGTWLSGLCIPNRDTVAIIIVYAGEHMEVPSFYHELCHLNVDSGNGHIDPRWPEWRARQVEVCQFLIRGRSR